MTCDEKSTSWSINYHLLTCLISIPEIVALLCSPTVTKGRVYEFAMNSSSLSARKIFKIQLEWLKRNLSINKENDESFFLFYLLLSTNEILIDLLHFHIFYAFVQCKAKTSESKNSLLLLANGAVLPMMTGDTFSVLSFSILHRPCWPYPSRNTCFSASRCWTRPEYVVHSDTKCHLSLQTLLRLCRVASQCGKRSSEQLFLLKPTHPTPQFIRPSEESESVGIAWMVGWSCGCWFCYSGQCVLQ